MTFAARYDARNDAWKGDAIGSFEFLSKASAKKLL